MSSGDDQGLAIARTYATAIFHLAKPLGQLESLREELADVAALLDKEPAFEAFLSNPTVDSEARQRTIEKVFRGRAGDVLVDSLQVLNRNDRLGLIRRIAEAYRLLLHELNGRVEVHVRTATPLTDALRDRLRTQLEETTRKKPDLVEKVDESLIGGMIVQIGDHKYDNSVLRKLQTLAGSLLERASREIHGGRVYTVGHAN